MFTIFIAFLTHCVSGGFSAELPDVLVGAVGDFLDGCSLVKALQTSRGLKLALTSSITRLDLSECSQEDYSFLLQFTSLNDLNLGRIDHADLSVLPRLPGVQSLSVTVNPRKLLTGVRLLERWPDLQELRIHSARLDNVTLREFDTLVRLRILDLTMIPEFWQSRLDLPMLENLANL